MEEVITYLNNLFKSNDKVIVAVSGGADSMCLLDLIMKLNKDVNIVVCHVNHKVRKESDNEYEYIKKYCQDNNIIFEGMEISKQIINNFESEARKIRYEFFNKMQKKYDAKYIVTAHHGDDLIETILMRITRGSNLQGYIGIKMKDGRFVRPLLNVTKKDILEYVKIHNITYFDDKTNYTDEHTRNRYRKIVLPFLKKENNNAHLKYLKFSEELQEYDNFVNNYIKSIHNLYNNEYINIDVLIKESEFVQKKIISNEIKKLQKNNWLEISDNALKNILNLIKSKKSCGYVNISNEFIATKEHGLFYISKIKNVNKFNTLFENSYTNDLFKVYKVTNCNENSNNVIRLNLEDIKLPLYVRSFNKDDVMEVKNLGHKKVSRIFNENKISSDIKALWPIISDSEGKILWIPGLKKSKFDKDKTEKCDIILTSERKINK